MRWHQRTRWFLVVALALLVAGLLHFARPAPSRVDFGAWRAVVVHSDDWGMEGWFPTDIDDSLRAVLSDGVPAWQAAYLSSTLESGAEIDSLASFLAVLTDSDGRPLILQANTIMAGPSVRAPSAAGAGWPVHASGHGEDYARPGLDPAVDRAIAAGVWWPELHGLTHYNLAEYAQARAELDPLALAGARQGCFAYPDFRTRSELDGTDPQAALAIAEEAVGRFRLRFGRSPESVIAPDYRWGAEDEAAWAQLGLRIVQAKREQVDGAIRPYTRLGRLRKWIGRQVFALRGDLFAVERTVDLEPYGDPDFGSAQGAVAAHRALEAALHRGQPGVVSIHRVQLVSTDPAVAAAGRAQLAELVRLLQRAGGVRFLVDSEVRQLHATGWSVRALPDGFLVRNWTGQPCSVMLPDGSEVAAGTGTSVWREKVEAMRKKSRN